MAIDSKGADHKFDAFLIIMDEQLDWLHDEAQKRGISLAMTLADLPKLENLFDFMSQGMSKDDVSGLVIACARHLGEVLVQSHGGQWHLALEDPMNANFDTPVIKGHSQIEGLEFASFYDEEGFGPATATRAVAQSSLGRYRGKIPDQLLRYWQQYGWGGYGNGLFWLVDPDEYEPALEAWIGDTQLMEQDSFYVIGRSAFGELFLWGTRSGQSLNIKSLWGMLFPRDNSERVARGLSDRLMRSFLMGRTKKDLDQKDHLDNPLFVRAVKALGPLAPDEMYGFEPALAAGGKADLKNLRKVKAVEHLVMLAQLGERQIMRDIVKDAKAQRLI